MHSIWSGTLSFGLVNIPVRLYPATNEHSLDLHLLHKIDHSPIRYARICKQEEDEVPYKDIVKGYEYEKGQYVVLTDKDFENVNVKKTNSIEIQNFVLDKEIDDIYFEKPYYLEPDKGSAKAYILLKEALKRSKKVAIATFVLRNREHLGMIKPYKDILVLNQLRYFKEIREIEELKVPASEKVNAKELEMSLKLITQLTAKFKPKNYHDNYSEELEKMIENKIKGRVVTRKGEVPKVTKVYDIMSRLKASIKQSEGYSARRKRQVKSRKSATIKKISGNKK